jgi:hypothetical protein
LNISTDITKKNLHKILKEIILISRRGRYLNFIQNLKCQYAYCENSKLKRGDEVVCFSYCFHLYHKFCFQLMNNSTEVEFGELENMFKIKDECKICSKILMD